MDFDDGISVRDRKLLEGVLAGKSQRQAAIEAGYTPAGADQGASRALSRPELRRHVLAWLNEAGLDGPALISKLHEGLDAERVELDRMGVAHDLGPDHRARATYLELALRLGSYFPDPRLDVVHHGSVQVVHLQAEDSLGSAGNIIDVTPAG